MNKTLSIGVTLVVAIGAGFLGGMQYQKTKIPQGFAMRNGNFRNGGANSPGGSGAPRNGLNMMRGGAVTGEVTAADDKSITVKMNDGSSRIVYLSDSTSYRLSTESKKSDLAVGKTVAVFGSGNSDGSTTAASIEINPPERNQPNK